jgi:sulfite reductase alpha subunit-like flavoprotein
MRRTILEVFQDFASIRLPYKFLFNIVPPLRPRQFSIASSSAVSRKVKNIHCLAYFHSAILDKYNFVWLS